MTTPDQSEDSAVQGEFLRPEVQERQDWERLGAYLRSQGLAFAPRPAPRQFAGGFGNVNYLIELDGRPAVLRRPPAGPLPPGANDMAREHRVLSRLWRAFPLAPRSLHFCDDETVLGAPFFVMEYRPGLVVRRQVPEALLGRERELSAVVIDILADLHAVRPEAVDLEALGRPEGFLGRAVAGWTKRLGVASADVYDDGSAPPAARELTGWLAAEPLPEGDVSLLHNDFKMDNIVLDPAAPTTPVAVLDWDMCTRGDPLFDLATLLSYWAEAGDPPAMHEMGQMPTAQPGFLDRRAVVDLYAARTGRDVSAILFHRVLCMFKLGVVFLQLYARHCRGTVSDPRFAALGPIADGVFEFGVEIAKGRAF